MSAAQSDSRRPEGQDAAPSPLVAESEDVSNEYYASLCLRCCPGLGAVRAGRLLSRYGSAGRAVAACRSWRRDGLADKRLEAVFLAGGWEAAARREYEAARSGSLSPLCWADPRYPEQLRRIPDPPVLLYTLGDLSLLSNPCLSVVGSRSCSRYGAEAAETISRDLSDAGVTVCSGLAQGIDRLAHVGGLSGVGGSIAVLGTGIDLVYPDSNLDVWKSLAESGLIVTEFAPGARPSARNFPIRNRIISGLSLGVVVVEAASRSGSLITARLAMEQGREVFAMPGPTNLPTFRGCHDLINKGALLVAEAGDILAELRPGLEAHLRKAPRPRRSGQRPRIAEAEPPVRSVRAKAATPPLLRPAGDSSGDSAGDPTGASAAGSGAAAFAAAPAPPPSPDAADLGETEQAVFEHLLGVGKAHIDEAGRALGLSGGRISRALLVLELKGLVRKLPGMYYSTER